MEEVTEKFLTHTEKKVVKYINQRGLNATSSVEVGQIPRCMKCISIVVIIIIIITV